MERQLVKLLVTPRAHGIHHSQVQRETDSNFGVVLTLWDRLHRTLRLNVPQQALTIGVPAYPDPAAQTVAAACWPCRWSPCAPGPAPTARCPRRPEPAGPQVALAE